MNKEINELKANDIDNQKENKIEKSTNILFGVTGSVAAIKTVHICKEILQQINGAVIKMCITKSAKHFLNSYGMNELKNKMKIDIYSDETEWISWNKRGDSVVHIELRKWANIFLIAPLSANSLAKLSNGLSDNLLTSIFRAWNFDDKTVIVAPAMNTKMWNNPFTNKQLNTLKKLFKSKFIIISPISKKLECNDIGMGAMATPKHIVKITKNILQKQFKFRFINNQREKAILFAYDLFEKHKKESSETILKIIDYIICNPLCNVNQIDLINVISQNNNISSTYQRKILLLSSYLETVVPIFIPQSIAINISEYTIQSLKWTHIYNYLSNEIIKDLTIMTIIRIPSTITNRNHRIGVIIGTYPHTPNINVEVHRNGKLRYYWNNGEVDLYGPSNLVDDKKHIIAFVRDAIKKEILIYLDGKLEIKINKCGTNMIVNTKCFLFGRDYRNESMAFRGDILRINVWYEAMSLNDIINIGNEWNENEYILEKQKQFELNIKANNNVMLDNFTVISLIKIPKEIGMKRVGIILGNYNKTSNISFGINTIGRTRLYWNSGEIDLFGKLNLVDNELHCVIFMRDVENGIISIYVDGKLDISINTIGSNVNYDGSLKIGRDYRGDYDNETSFKGDIFRVNAYTTTFNQKELQQISYSWLA